MFRKIWKNPYLRNEVLESNRGLLAEYAIKIGYLKGLIYNSHYLKFMEFDMNHAVRNGQLHVLQWLFQTRPQLSINLVDLALTAGINGHLDILKWLYKNEKFTKNPRYMYINVVNNGHLHILKWFHEQNMYKHIIPEAIPHAAENGTLDIIKWFHENYTNYFELEVLRRAVNWDQLETVKWLWENRPEMRPKNISWWYTNELDKNESLKWLSSQIAF